jgi:GTP cyclohydrolase I
MEAGIRLFLEGIGERFPGDDLERTPARVADAWAEDLVAGYGSDPQAELTYTEAPERAGLVLVRDIPFTSICVHHLLPSFGRAHVAYLPAQRLAGLSKIARLLEALARRLQIQERLTEQVLDALVRGLQPQGALVLLDAEHTCMTLRGTRKEGSRLVTVASSGVYADPAARREVIDLLGRPGR